MKFTYLYFIYNYSTINSTSSPFLTPAAFPSSTSTCISNAKLGFALTNTFSNTTALGPKVLTLTICLSVTPKFLASSSLICICLEATITPSDNSTSPAGPTNLTPGVPAISPDSFIGAFIPNANPSAKDISTCSDNSTSPAGPTNLTPGVPAISPDSFIGAFIPNANPSAKDISTCVAGLAGPKTLTPFIAPFGPTKSTFSSQAYYPG